MGSARQEKPAAARCHPGQELTLPLHFSDDSDLGEKLGNQEVRPAGGGRGSEAVSLTVFEVLSVLHRRI